VTHFMTKLYQNVLSKGIHSDVKNLKLHLWTIERLL